MQWRPDNARSWGLPHFVIVTYTLFLAGFYLVPNAVDHYKFYIALVFLPGLFLLPTALRRTRHSLIWLSLLTYLAYMLLSSFWSQTFSVAALWREVCYIAYLLVFVLLTVYLCERDHLLPQAIMLVVALVAIAAAITSVLTFKDLALLPALTEQRLIGLGTMDNPNPSAFIYGFCGIIALDYARRHRGQVLSWICASGVLVIFVFVILTQSNTGLLALSMACSLLFLTDHRNSRTSRPALFIGLALVVFSVFFLAWSLGLISHGIDLGFINRLPIWQHVLQLWLEAPIFGQGYQETLLLQADGTPSPMNYAHSLFLATLRDGGIVGLALLLLVYFCALRSALKMAIQERRSLYLCLFLFGVVCVLVDTDQVVTRPRELWIILWLPLAWLIAYELGLTGSSSTTPAAGSPKNT